MATIEEEREKKRKAAAMLGGVPAVTPIDEPGTRAREAGYAAGQALGAEAGRIVGDLPVVRATKSIAGDIGEVRTPRAAGEMIRGAAGEALGGVRKTWENVPGAAYKTVAKPVGEFFGGLAGRPDPQASEELAGIGGVVPTPPGTAAREELSLVSPHQERPVARLGGVPATERPIIEEPAAMEPARAQLGGVPKEQPYEITSGTSRATGVHDAPPGMFGSSVITPEAMQILQQDWLDRRRAGGELEETRMTEAGAAERLGISEAGATARAQLGGRDNKAQLDFLKSDVGRLQKAAAPGEYGQTAENVIAGYQEIDARNKYGQASGMAANPNIDEDAASVLLGGMESFAQGEDVAAQRKLFNAFMKSSPKRQDLILDRMTPQARNIYQELRAKRKARK